MENSSLESISTPEPNVIDAEPSESNASSSVEVQVSTAPFKNPAQPYTALKEPLKEGVGSSPKQIRFFGPRFMAIWVMPIAITGIIMEFLFVGPARNVNPFN